MGVPTFFRWLCMRYPRTVVDANLRKDLPPFDNLYLDMNGIIHPCCNPPEPVILTQPKPSSEQEMFQNIMEYIQQLVHLVNPRKLLYLAIDGVAPRAKLNQQRSRRFRKIQQENQKPISQREQGRFDSNLITPGTPFMHRLSEALHRFIVVKLETRWSHLKVIFSDSNNPGEGEHKILEFIRIQRNQSNYNPNIRHVIYGADADLIMLALISHEPHFYVVRENVIDSRGVVCSMCGQKGHFANECQTVTAQRQLDASVKMEPHKFCFVKLPVVREYLFFEFKDLTQYPKYDFERVVDDFVFLCFFVGNDFLPHLPSLNIRDGAIDGLIYLYCKIFYKLGGFITENGKILLYKLDILLEELSKIQQDYFVDKGRRYDQYIQRNLSFKRKQQQIGTSLDLQEQKHKQQTAKKILQQDTIQIGRQGWKFRYYTQKFGIIQQELQEFKSRIQLSYIQGLCWVFQYYFNGCQSWSWYYSYHYAPFASDLLNSYKLPILFQLGQPFPPYVQLMSVLPPQSAGALPDSCRVLLQDKDSILKDYYPQNFRLDINGKRYSWQGVMLLPFIQQKRIMQAFAQAETYFTQEERIRNSIGSDILYMKETNLEINVALQHIAPLFAFYNETSSSVKTFTIKNPKKLPHQSRVLVGVELPPAEVDQQVFRAGDRRGYGGYNFINLISRHLAIDARQWNSQRENPYQHFSRHFNNNSRQQQQGEKRFRPNPPREVLQRPEEQITDFRSVRDLRGNPHGLAVNIQKLAELTKRKQEYN